MCLDLCMYNIISIYVMVTWKGGFHRSWSYNVYLNSFYEIYISNYFFLVFAGHRSHLIKQLCNDAMVQVSILADNNSGKQQ